MNAHLLTPPSKQHTLHSPNTIQTDPYSLHPLKFTSPFSDLNICSMDATNQWRFKGAGGFTPLRDFIFIFWLVSLKIASDLPFPGPRISTPPPPLQEFLDPPRAVNHFTFWGDKMPSSHWLSVKVDPIALHVDYSSTGYNWNTNDIQQNFVNSDL